MNKYNLFLRSIEECHYQHRNPPKDTLYELYLPENLANHQFCAGNVDVNVRTSFGDSGGPAFRRFVRTINQQRKQEGDLECLCPSPES